MHKPSIYLGIKVAARVQNPYQRISNLENTFLRSSNGRDSPLDVSTWIRKLGLDFKDSFAPYILSCIFPYHQIKVDEHHLCAAINYWVPSRHVFCFNKIELCPTIEKFTTIMGEPEIDDLIFPTMGRDLPFSLLRVMLGVLKA